MFLGLSLPNSKNPGFGQSRMNMLVNSDAHGKLDKLPPFWSTVSNNLSEVFSNQGINRPLNDINVLNTTITNGDWFMDPGRGDYLTHPDKLAGDFQLAALNKLNDQVGVELKASGSNSELRHLYVPGNHCFDGEAKNLFGWIKKGNFTTVLTNADHNEKNIKSMEILEIPNDRTGKNDKVLVLGVLIPGMGFYCPGKMMDGIKVWDSTNKKDSKIQEKDIRKTFNGLNKIISEFKDKNPDGAVVIMAHTGQKISRMIGDNVPNIDLMINGHDHKEGDETLANGTRLISIDSDLKAFNGIQLHFNDEGKLDVINNKAYKTKDEPKIRDNPFEAMLNEFFVKDRKPFLHVSGPQGTKLNPNGTEVRKTNSHIANFVTDGVLSQIQKTHPQAQIFGMPSSAFRQDLKVNNPDGNDNLAVRNIFNDQSGELSEVSLLKISGKELVKAVEENLADHFKDEERNTIIQWSGVQVDKKSIKEGKQVAESIKVKDKEGKYQPVNPSGEYTVAIPDYFFFRPKVKTFENKKQGERIGKNLHQLFREYVTRPEHKDGEVYKVTVPTTSLENDRIIT